ncbi:helix-turn-helix transcriptional regulator [Proteinivorax hydrogeniformans]|uniref:Helix-turn-helix transcriptional regulator n=1 Tax=Proteinivorax hydrogeniformans TaxID=1826727 RepID=A0AAU8HUK4_9FIRM
MVIPAQNIKLKLARTAKQLSQQQLAERVEVTRQTISLIEQGKYNPSLKLCISICKALDKTLDDIFWDDSL